MCIIAISKKSKMKNKEPKSHIKFQNALKVFKLCIVILIFNVCVLYLLTGCIRRNKLDEARRDRSQSEVYYQRAIVKYQDLIVQGKDKDQVYLELGLIYYKHSEYELASRYLSKSALPEAKKYQALALYKINDFTGAQDAFKNIDNPESEALYYYGEVCEKLNLYDQALDIYSRVTQEPFKTLAGNKVQLITKRGENLCLEDLSIDLQNIIKNAPSAEKYPNAGVLILFCDEKAEISLNNTAVFSAHNLIKILNDRGKQNYSEIVLGYDSTYEKIELEYARIIRPDGIVVYVGSRHIRDVSKYLNFPLYSNARVKIISFPEITDGCVIEYKYKIYRNQLINEDDITINYSLQESDPVIQAQFRLVIPKDKPVHYKVLNSGYNTSEAKLDPVMKEIPGYKEYLWEFKDVPAIIPEANMPPNSKINPIILISTFGSWQEVYDWWWNKALDKIRADEAIKQKVEELTVNKQAVIDKIKAIYNFCAENIRYVAVGYGQAGYEPHKATDIFFNKYGDCKDQAILLITMLKEIDVECYPVLIGTDDYLDLEEDFPSVNFNHCIAAVRLDGELIFLDPTCETCSFGNLPSGDQQRKVLVFTDSGYKIQTIPLQAAGHNALRQTLKLEIQADETIRAERLVYTSGLYDVSQRFWLKYSSEDAISEIIKQAIQDISPAARLIKYDIDNLDDLNKNVVLNYSFSGKEYWTRAGDLRIFPQLTLYNTSITAKEIRRYPLDLGLPTTRIIELDVVLPQVVKLKYLPGNFQESSDWLDLSVEYNIKGTRLYFKQMTWIKKRFVLLSEYPEFKAFMENLSTKLRERVIFERDEAQ
ncbi:MAG: DUF3857 domain-containing protein [Candidatus Omnitrophota bacterium]